RFLTDLPVKKPFLNWAEPVAAGFSLRRVRRLKPAATGLETASKPNFRSPGGDFGSLANRKRSGDEEANCMIRLTSLLLAVVCGLTTCGQAAASPPPIKDEAHMFSPEAIERATADIQEIKRLYQTDLVFEFVPSVPADNWWNKFKKKVLHSKEP